MHKGEVLYQIQHNTKSGERKREREREREKEMQPAQNMAVAGNEYP